MPTLIKIDSFQHQVLRVANAAAANDWYRLITDAGTSAPSHGGGNITFDTGIKRTADHVCSLKMVHSNTVGIQVRYGLATGLRDVNVSFYFRTVDTTNPGESNVPLFRFGSTENGDININTSGQIVAELGGATQTGAVDVCDGEWHRIDARYQTSVTNAGTLDVQVDGTALTQVVDTTFTPQDCTDLSFGLTTATLDYTIYYSDLAASATGADYPMGDHIVRALEINGTGTHSPSTGAFTDQAGGTSDAALLAAVDDAWDGTTPELSQTGEDYVQQTANAAAGYVEFTLDDPTESVIWGAQLGTLMASEDATTAMTCETRLVDSGGNTLATTGLIDPSISATVYSGYRIIASAPGGGWDGTALSGCKVRFGFSTDAAPDALFNSAIVEYAAPWSAAEEITAALLDVPATIHSASLQHRITGTLLDQAPTLHQATTQNRLTTALLDKAPTIHAASLRHALGPSLLSITPDLLAASIDTGGDQLDANLLDITPALHQASLQERLAANLLDKAPTLHQASLVERLTAALLDKAPTLHQAALRRNLAAALLDKPATLHQATVTQATIIGANVVDVVPVMHQTALRIRLAAALLDQAPILHQASVAKVLRAALLDVVPQVHSPAVRLHVLAALLNISPELLQAAITQPGLLPVFLTEGDADATSTYLEGDGGGAGSIEGDALVGAGLEG